MGIFSKKTTEVVEETTKTAAPKKSVAKASTKAKKAAAVPAVKVAGEHVPSTMFGSVILRPRITEKSTMKAETENVYVFEIAKSANKVTVRKAISDIYKVQPTKVSIAYNPTKKVFPRGRAGFVSGVKKVYVYLKKGDKIEIV
jgi:large subunit ribosomal protein L23